VLLSIPALADPKHKDRIKPVDAVADLIWFPTGGGKTEAYLGVAAFTMAIRRIQKDLGGLDGSRGLSVIMRYTLRLLTLQQFQRATTLICAMETIRRKDEKSWGTTPFTIGLWVGQKVTPNSTEASHDAIEAERTGRRPTSSSPSQLANCPWCGAEIASGRDIEVRRFKSSEGRTLIHCLVCTVLTWSRPRDLSHYESFEHYHATFYKHVEAQSMTPFAPRALDRGLSGTMISWLRLAVEEFNANLGAEQMNSASIPEVGETKKVISERAWRVTDLKAAQELSEAMVGERCDEWIKEATRGGRKLGYEAGKKRKKGEDDIAALLKKPGIQSWDHFTVPMSMREVEPGVRLVMLTDNLPEGPPWKIRPKKKEEGGAS